MLKEKETKRKEVRAEQEKKLAQQKVRHIIIHIDAHLDQLCSPWGSKLVRFLAKTEELKMLMEKKTKRKEVRAEQEKKLAQQKVRHIIVHTDAHLDQLCSPWGSKLVRFFG